MNWSHTLDERTSKHQRTICKNAVKGGAQSLKHLQLAGYWHRKGDHNPISLCERDVA